MNAREKGLDLIERYLHSVGEELPAPQRDDVIAELRSLLTEQLDERVAAGEPPEGAAVELLQSFGKPGDVAMRYAPPGQYLIGPHVYPYFLYFARITFYLIVGMFVFWSAFAWLTGNTRLPEFFRPGSLVSWFVELAKLLAINMAVMVVVFAALERLYKPSESAAKKTGKSWDPRDLPEVPATADPHKISESAITGKIYAIVVLAVLLNFFPRWFGVLIFSSKGTLAIPYTAFGIFLPVALLNVWWAGALALNLWLLNLRRWTREARWIELALNVLGSGILFIVINASSFGVDPEWLSAGQEGSAPERLMRVLQRSLPWSGSMLRFVLSVILICSVIEAVMRLVRILRRYPVT